MKLYKGFSDKKIKKHARSVAIGIFDGVHRGHLKILGAVLKDAKKNKRCSCVVTFDPHPNKVLRPHDKHPILMSLPHRLRLFEKLGIDEAVVVSFNKRFSKVSHKAFLNSLLLNKLGMRLLCVGHDFRFGYKGAGDVDFLKNESKKHSYSARIISPLKQKGQIVSSTQIRKLIEKGKLEKASRMLGRCVSVYGDVVHGRGRGKGLGFPTANLNPHHETLPPSGVYAAWGFWNGRKLKGVIHIGRRPTFQDKDKSLEVHFLNFHKDIYGQEIELHFVKYLRAIRRFPNPKALMRAIAQDIRQAETTLYKKASYTYNTQRSDKLN